MSRRRRSRGRGGARLVCSASAAGEARGRSPGGGNQERRGATPPGPAPAPGLTHVQRGGERVEAGDGRRVLAAGHVQARAAAEGALGVGLRAHGRSPRARRARRAPAAPARTHHVVDAELV